MSHVGEVEPTVLTVEAADHLAVSSTAELVHANNDPHNLNSEQSVFTITMPTMNNIMMPANVEQQNALANDFAKFNFRLQSMLLTLKKPHIRDDFLGGRIINVQDHKSILFSLDIVHDLLLSDWCVTSNMREQNHSLAVDHARALYDKSPDSFPLVNSSGYEISNYTYGAWNEAIEEVFKSPYWKELMNENQNQHIIYKQPRDDFQPSPSKPWGVNVANVKRELHNGAGNMDVDGSSSQANKSYTKSYTPTRKVTSPASRAANREKRAIQIAAGLKVHQCSECTYSSARLHVLETHINTVHKGLKPYKCDDCPDSFGHASTLKSHVNTVHKGLKPFKCPQCSYAFGHSSTLKAHVNTIHKGLKPYKCDQCNYAAGQLTNLRTHINHVHKGLKKNTPKRAANGVTIKKSEPESPM